MEVGTKANPMVSVITVVFNAKETLEATMLSVLAQDWPHLEYIVIDGGSTDGTVDVIRRYAPRLSAWVSESDEGIYDAMNKGLRMATGEWVHFLNAGDCFASSDVLTRCMEAVLPGDGVVYGDCFICYSDFTRLMVARRIEDIVFGLPSTHQSILVLREQAGIWSFELEDGIAADYGVVARLARMGVHFRYVAIPMVSYQAGGLSDVRRLSVLSSTWAISRKHFGLRWDTTVYFPWALLLESFKALLKMVLGRAFMDRLRGWKHRNHHHLKFPS
jgi:glycosyltransferase involved in cell wall biosynthesis